MAENTKIEWCTHTHNFWVGCTKVSPACDHCYAEGWAKRTGQASLWQGDRRRTTQSNWRQPLKWNRAAQASGERTTVFCNSLSDFFDNQVPPDWRTDAWDLIRQTPHLTWLALTKRPQNIVKMLPEDWGRGYPNVWLGTTAENQQEADRRIPHLLAVPAAKRFLSVEPMLGPVYLRGSMESRYLLTHPPKIAPRIDWVITGGESGPKARPFHPDWVRAVRDQCVNAGVPFFHKQNGEFSYEFDRDRDDPDGRVCDQWRRKPGRWINLAGGQGFHGDRVHYAHRVGKKRAGAMLDGREWMEMPG